MIITCIRCATQVVRDHSFKFCSRTCYGAHRTENKRGRQAHYTVVCTHCGVTVQRPRPRKYCSKECSGAAHTYSTVLSRPNCRVCDTKLRLDQPHGTYCSKQCASQAGAGNRPKWDSAFCARVTELWGTGMSTTQIGLALTPQVSKNVVIGLAHRLKLPDRPSPLRRSGDPDLYPTRPRPGRALGSVNRTTARVLPVLASLAPPIVIAARKPPPQPQRRPEPPLAPAVPDPAVKTCQYPTNDTRPYTWCGEVVSPGRPYCEAHCRICYNPWPPRSAYEAIAA